MSKKVKWAIDRPCVTNIALDQLFSTLSFNMFDCVIEKISPQHFIIFVLVCLQRFLPNIWWKMGSALHHNFICGIIRAGNILISDAISHLTNTKTNAHHHLTHHQFDRQHRHRHHHHNRHHQYLHRHLSATIE